jgi:hypothetical protein
MRSLKSIDVRGSAIFRSDHAARMCGSSLPVEKKCVGAIATWRATAIDTCDA